MIKYISHDRLHIYVKHLKVEPEQVISAYYWNKALAGAMLPAMQCLEITLRNAIDHAIQTHPPSGASGLWLTDHNWITSLSRYIGNKSYPKNKTRYKMAKNSLQLQNSQGILLDKYGHRIIAKKVKEEKCIDDVRDRINKEGKNITPSRIIAGLNFGFWTTLLSQSYEDPYSFTLLWPNLQPFVFPNSPNHYSMNDIRNAFYKIRLLRNRLSHHEALWKFYYDDHKTNKLDYNNPVYGAHACCNLLRKHYDAIIQMIGWISLDIQADFIKNQANIRFYSLCSTDGLNSYIAPEKISNKVTLSRGGKSIKKIVNAINNQQFIRILKNGKTVLTIGSDNSKIAYY